jgi:beta-lactamase regulating signal transducer with metallopeptidase domain
MSGFDTVAGSVLTTVIDAAGRSAVLALLAAASIALCRVRRGAMRLAVWRWVLCVCLLMPVLGALLPAIDIPVPASDWRSPSPSPSLAFGAVAPAPELRGGLAAVSTAALSATQVPWIRTAGLLYFAGLLVFAVRTTRSWAAARDLSRRAGTIGDEPLTARAARHAAALALKSRPRLAESSEIAVPVTAGVRGPVILLPSSWRTWDEDTLDAVLLHELSHIRRADAVTQRLALAYRIIHWPNPLAWWIERHLAALAEVASDEAVLASRVAPARYAEILLAFLAVAGRPSAAHQWHVAMARVTGVERRIHRVLTWKERRPMSHPTLRYAMTAAGVVVLAATLSAARVEMLAAPVPVTVPAPEALVSTVRTLPAPPSDIAIRRADAPQPASTIAVVEPQAHEAQQSRPSTPADDFAKGAYPQDTPGLTVPVMTRSERPRYTAEAMRAKLQGDIHLEIVVSNEGYVTRARVAGVSGNLEFLGVDTRVEPVHRNLGLDEQALAAIRQWRFQPGTLNGVAVPVLTSVSLSFRLF